MRRGGAARTRLRWGPSPAQDAEAARRSQASARLRQDYPSEHAQGMADFARGQAQASNPFPAESPEAAAWTQGWILRSRQEWD